MEVVTAQQRRVQNRSWYEKIRRTPFLTAHIRPSASLAEKMRKVEDSLRRVDSRQVYTARSRLHVTVKELGWLGEDVKRRDLPKVLSIIREVARDQGPFNLSVEGVGVFPTVIYGRIGKGAGEIRRLNMELAARLHGSATRNRYDGVNMKPHITMAHFSSRSVGPLLAEARRLKARPVGSMRVEELILVKYQARELFGLPARETLATFALGRRKTSA